MPIPDNQAPRRLPKDFVWGYATGKLRSMYFGEMLMLHSGSAD